MSGKRGDNADGRGQLQLPQCQARTTPALTATDHTATAGTATQPQTRPRRSAYFIVSQDRRMPTIIITIIIIIIIVVVIIIIILIIC